MTAVIALLSAVGVAVLGLRGQRVQSAATTEVAVVTKQVEIETVNIKELWARVDRVETRAEARITKLEEALVLANSQNDALVIKNAELNATVTLQAAQIAQMQSDLTQYKSVLAERDNLRQELNEARRRIASLEREVSLLKNPKLTNMQQSE